MEAMKSVAFGDRGENSYQESEIAEYGKRLARTVDSGPILPKKNIRHSSTIISQHAFYGAILICIHRGQWMPDSWVVR